MKPSGAVAFVRRHGVVLQSAKGPAPSLAEWITGEPIRGSWWGHTKGRLIYQASQNLLRSPAILVSRLLDGRVTYVHRRLWPALVRVAARLPKARLARVWDEHTAAGKHVTKRIPFPRWVPPEVMEQAKAMSSRRAEELISPYIRPGRRGWAVGALQALMSRPPFPVPRLSTPDPTPPVAR